MKSPSIIGLAVLTFSSSEAWAQLKNPPPPVYYGPGRSVEQADPAPYREAAYRSLVPASRPLPAPFELIDSAPQTRSANEEGFGSVEWSADIPGSPETSSTGVSLDGPPRSTTVVQPRTRRTQTATAPAMAFTRTSTTRNPIGPLVGRPPDKTGPRRPTRRIPLRRPRAIPRRPSRVDESPCAGLWNLPRLSHRTFKVGEELGYELSVAGAYVGRFETKVGRPRRVNGKRVLPLFGRARTTGFASSFRPFVGRYMAMAEPDRLAPVGIRVESTYDKDERWERVNFDRGGKAVRADFTFAGANFDVTIPASTR